MNTDTRTIMELLVENPNVDVSKAWERCRTIHSKIVTRVRDRRPCEPHPSCAG